MATTQSAAVTVFGLKNITIHDYSTKLPLYFSNIPASLTIPFETGIEQLFGGANKYVIEAEPTYMSGEIALKFKQNDPKLFQYLAGATVTTVATESTTGAVTTLANAYGTTCKSATIGIDSVALDTTTADLKAGVYVVKVVSATTVDVYLSTALDFDEGTTPPNWDDDGKITATALTITTSGAFTSVPGFGIKLKGGSGTIGMTVGHTAWFKVRPANISNSTIVLGQNNITYNKVMVTATAQKKGSKETFQVYMPKCQPYGFNLPLAEFKFAEVDPKLILLQSNAENMICEFTRISRQAD